MATFCASTTERASLEIFSQFRDSFKFVAAFGNPNINFSGDWLATIVDETNSVTKAGTTDASRQSCKLVSALEVEILTSQLGYIDSVQNYVVGARVKGIEKEWVFDNDGSA